MATRFYWGQVITDPAIAFSATWSAPGSTPTRLLMRTVKRKATVTPIVATASETTAGVLNKQAVQLISMPLAAQTITGTVKGYALFSDSDTAQDCRVQCEIRIISRTGTVRGTLLASDTGALSSEFSTTPTNRRIPLLAATNTLTSVTAEEGDHLVVEIGHRTHSASTTSYSVTVQWNDDPSSTDLPEDETDTDTSKAPWIEFSQDLVLTDYFEDNTLISFQPGGNGSEFRKTPIPDLAPRDARYDILADLNTPAIPESTPLDNVVVVTTVSGTTPNLYIEDNTLISFRPVSNSSEFRKTPIPDLAPRDRRYDILASMSTPFISESIVINSTTTTTITYTNRVYDSVASKLIRWVTNTPDVTGASYPGPGVFGVNTSNYVIENIC